MVLMTVKCLRQRVDGDDAVLVLETATGDRHLGFVIPMNEANRLARVIGVSTCRCSPVYDLLLAIGSAVGATVRDAVLDASPEGIGATLRFAHSGGEFSIACHPADAVALALQSRAPVYATREALSHACAVPSPGDALGPVAQWLASVRPADFGEATA